MSRFEGKMLAPVRSLSAFFDDGKRCLLAVYWKFFFWKLFGIFLEKLLQISE